GYTSLSDRMNSSESIATFPQSIAQGLSQTTSHSYNIASVPLSQTSIAATSIHSASLEQTIKLLTLVKGWIKDGSQ
ncbi:MAG TPA: hypothetical protein V6C65_12570, partial [Allocoleopsis sp.]